MKLCIKNPYLPLATLLLAGASGTAAASETGLEVTLELADRTRKVAPVAFTLSLEGPEGCASADDRTARGELHVQVCREGGEADRPILGFVVDRTLNVDRGTERRQFRVRARLVRGERQLIGRLGEGEGAMELVAGLARTRTKK